MEHEDTYDVVIIGGAMIGSSIAWHLVTNADFDGRVLVIERDPTYEACSTTHTNSCIRAQYSIETNILISLYGIEFIRNFRELMGHEDAPDLRIQDIGYLYLAGNDVVARRLKEACELQNRLGADTRILTPDQMAREYPFMNLDGVVLGSHGASNEGMFDGPTIFQWWRRRARDLGATYLHDEVVAIERNDRRVESVSLASGRRIKAGCIVNAAGPRANVVAQMAGLSLPVEARRRFTYVFSAKNPPPSDMPLIIDPSGVHMRPEGNGFLCGCPPDIDTAMAFDDFSEEPGVWENKLWPGIAARIPAFEDVRVTTSWVGHYAFNTFDQNALLGPMEEVENLYFANGFSGHGLQQSPAVGRGISELIAYGTWKSLDLEPLSVRRLADNRPLREANII